MKKKYRVTYSIYLLFLIFTIIVFYYGNHHNYKSYTSCTGTIRTYDRVELVIDQKNLVNLSKNKSVYVEGKKYKVTIENVMRNVLIRKKNHYHLVEVTIPLPKKYHILDMVDVTIYKKEKPLIHIFKSCWKGD